MEFQLVQEEIPEVRKGSGKPKHEKIKRDDHSKVYLTTRLGRTISVFDTLDEAIEAREEHDMVRTRLCPYCVVWWEAK